MKIHRSAGIAKIAIVAKIAKIENLPQLLAVPTLLLNGLVKSHRAGRKGTNSPQHRRATTKNQKPPQRHGDTEKTRKKPRLFTAEVTKEHEGESAEKPVVMKKKALFISGQNPYPCVNNGIERLMVGYEWQVFSDFDVYLLYYRE